MDFILLFILFIDCETNLNINILYAANNPGVNNDLSYISHDRFTQFYIESGKNVDGRKCKTQQNFAKALYDLIYYLTRKDFSTGSLPYN